MWSRFPRSIAAALGGCAIAAGVLALLAPSAQAERFDPALPVHIVVGKPLGHAPMARVDPSRSARTDELPDSLREIWQRSVRGGIELAPAVDEHGAVVVAEAAAEVTQIAADGKEQWRARLGMSGPSAGPVITSDGTRVVLTALGEVWGITATGAQKFRTDLSAMGRDPRVAPLPRDDGSVVVAMQSTLAVVQSDGSVKDRVSVGETIVGSILAWPGGVVATTDSGNVFVWTPPLAPRNFGSFKGSIRDGAALADPNTLVVVVDRRRLAAMDMRTGQVSQRASVTNLEGPPAVAPGGVAYAASLSGLLVGASAGGEVARIALSPQATAAEDGGIGVYYRPSPPVITDKAGRVAFVRGDGRFGVISPEGRATMAPSPACSNAVAIVPAGPRRFLLACQTGLVRMYGR